MLCCPNLKSYSDTGNKNIYTKDPGSWFQGGSVTCTKIFPGRLAFQAHFNAVASRTCYPHFCHMAYSCVSARPTYNRLARFIILAFFARKSLMEAFAASLAVSVDVVRCAVPVQGKLCRKTECEHVAELQASRTLR